MRVQMAVKRPNEKRWAFLAHGAAYEHRDALGMRQTLNRAGVKVMLLPLDPDD